jgi:hypothetical protein
MSNVYINKPIDARTGAVVSIDEAHSKQHYGKHFNATFYAIGGPSTAVSVLITAPPSIASSGNIVHSIFTVEADKGIYWTIGEAPNVGATTSTAIVVYNNDRNSTSTSGTVFVGNPSSYVSSGTILTQHVTGANGAPSIDANARNEFLLKSNTNYLVYVIPTSTTTQTIINCTLYLEV